MVPLIILVYSNNKPLMSFTCPVSLVQLGDLLTAIGILFDRGWMLICRMAYEVLYLQLVVLGEIIALNLSG